MRGHEPLIALRRRRLVPPSVWFHVGPDGFKVGRQWLRESDWYEHGELPMVMVAPEDPIRRLDLRFAVGLTCMVTATTDAQLSALVEALKAAGAARVIGMGDAGITDTQGVLTWQN